MSLITERIESLRQERDIRGQVLLHEEKAEQMRKTRLSEMQSEQRLAQFERLMGELGVRKMFEEIVEAETLEDAQINTFLGTDLANAFLQLKWPGKKGFREEYVPGVIVPPELGHYRIDVRYNFEVGTIRVSGRALKYEQDAELDAELSELNSEEMMEAIARVYLDPKWESATHIQLAEESEDRIPF